MTQSNNKRSSTLGALALIAVIAGTPAASARELAPSVASTATPASMFFPISTSIDNPTHDEPNGTCAMCFAASDGNGSGSSARIEIYFEDDGEDFHGDFELTLELNDSTLVDLTIVDASIVHQGTEVYTVNAGSTWDWTDVESVTIEAIPDV